MKQWESFKVVALAIAIAGLALFQPTHAQVSQTSKITVSVNSTLVKQLDLSTVDDQVLKNYATTLANGTGNGQANNVWHDQRTLTASSSEDLDLAGVLVSSNGQTLTFTKVKAILIKAATGNTNNVLVSRPASNGLPFMTAAGDELIVGPDGIFVVVTPNAGYTVTAATGDLLHIANSGAGTSVTYDVIIIGVA